MKIKMIYAYSPLDGNLVFGKGDELPWGYIKEDLDHFKEMTIGSTVIMGAKTFQSLPSKLPNRKHIVLASRFGMIRAKNGDLPDIVHKIDINLKNITELDLGDEDSVFFIGGANILDLVKHITDEIHISVIHGHYLGDVFLDSELAHDSDFMDRNFDKTSKVGNDVIFYTLKRKT